MSIPRLSAYYNAKERQNVTEPSLLGPWESNEESRSSFNSADGVFTVARDGLYAITVQILPSKEQSQASRGKGLGKRKRVDYVLRVEEPATKSADDDDVIVEEIFDVGAKSFGEVLHLSQGTTLAVMAMPEAGNHSLRFGVDIVQRKRKRPARSQDSQDIELNPSKGTTNLESPENCMDQPQSPKYEGHAAKKVKRTDEHSFTQGKDCTRERALPSKHESTPLCEREPQENNTHQEEELEEDSAWLQGFDSDESCIEANDQHQSSFNSA